MVITLPLFVLGTLVCGAGCKDEKAERAERRGAEISRGAA